MRSVPASGSSSARGRREVVGLKEELPRAWDERLPRRRQEDPAPVALEEPHAQQALELGQLRAQRGLRDAAAVGGTAKGELVGDGHRVLELAKRERVGCGGYDSQ